MKRQKPFIHWLAGLLGLTGLAMCNSVHAEFIYVLTNINAINGTTSNFARIDTVTGNYTSIVTNLGTAGAVSNLAYNPSVGNFYVTDGSTTNTTLKTLTTTGSLSSSLGGIDRTIYGMAYVQADNTLYAYDSVNNDTGTINPSNGAWAALNTNPGTTGTNPQGGRMVLLNGKLYAAINNSGVGQFGTYGFDALTNFSPIGNSDDLYRAMVLTTDGNTLYGLTSSTSFSTRMLYIIDPATGGLSTGLPINGMNDAFFHGAAMITADISEPPTLALGLAALPTLWLSRRRKP